MPSRYARYAIRGEPLTGRVRADPVAINLRILAMQLLLQAVRDARSTRSRRKKSAALLWLNTPEARGSAEAFNLQFGRRGQPITEQDLPARVRGTYFRGD